MRQRDALVCVLVMLVAASACSRLTFVKPDYSRKDEVIPEREQSFKPDRNARKRTAMRRELALAERELQAGELDKAEGHARAALKTDSGSFGAYTMLAMISTHRGDNQQAGGHYAKALELAPNSGVTLNNYGVWLCANQRAAESLPYFEQAIGDRGYHSRVGALLNAGRCAIQAGQLERAERDLRAVGNARPQDPEVLDALSELEYRRGDYMAARAFSQRRLAAGRATADALLRAADIERKLGDHAAAAKYDQMVQHQLSTSENRQRGDRPSQ